MKKLVIILLTASIFLTACSKDDSKSNQPINDAIPTVSLISSPNSAQPEGESVDQDQDIAQKVKEYILHGQDDKAEADKVKWSETFLNQVDIDAVYQAYLSSDGIADHVESFALYLTLNAPIPEDWESLVEADLLAAYGEKITRIEYLQDALYQVYVEKEGTEVPYVVVSSRTGYFQG